MLGDRIRDNLFRHFRRQPREGEIETESVDKGNQGRPIVDVDPRLESRVAKLEEGQKQFITYRQIALFSSALIIGLIVAASSWLIRGWLEFAGVIP